MKRIFLVLFVSLFLLFFAFTSKVDAMDNYVDEDGNVLYGWHMETNETDAETWEFDENSLPEKSIVIAILSLGIGFAAITDTLVFTGTVKSAGDEELSKNFIVKFLSAEVDYKTEDIDVAEIKISDDNLTVEFNVEGMSSAGSYVTFELVIVNESADLYANGATFEVYNYASNQITGASQMETNSNGQYITATLYDQKNPFWF